jgi:hypothetical protein
LASSVQDPLLTRFTLELLALQEKEAQTKPFSLNGEEGQDPSVFQIKRMDGKVYLLNEERTVLSIDNPDKTLKELRATQKESIEEITGRGILTLAKIDRQTAQRALPIFQNASVGLILPSFLQDITSADDFEFALKALVSQMTEFSRSHPKAVLFLGINHDNLDLKRGFILEKTLENKPFIRKEHPTKDFKGVLVQCIESHNPTPLIDSQRTLTLPVSAINPKELLAWGRFLEAGYATGAFFSAENFFQNNTLDFKAIPQAVLSDKFNKIHHFWSQNTQTKQGDIQSFVAVLSGQEKDSATLQQFAFVLPVLQKIALGARLALVRQMLQQVGGAA